MFLGAECLCVEGERSADFVSGLIELLGIEGCAETKGDSRAEENVVRNCGDTTVVDLDLSERDRIQSVLAGNLKQVQLDCQTYYPR